MKKTRPIMRIETKRGNYRSCYENIRAAMNDRARLEIIADHSIGVVRGIALSL